MVGVLLTALSFNLSSLSFNFVVSTVVATTNLLLKIVRRPIDCSCNFDAPCSSSLKQLQRLEEDEIIAAQASKSVDKEKVIVRIY